MWFTLWLLCPLVGLAAARTRGFSLIWGAIGGILLGPLAVLMFFVSSVGLDEDAKTCPHCAELIKRAAVVCRHCLRNVPESPAALAQEIQEVRLGPKTIGAVAILFLFVSVAVFLAVMAGVR